MDIDPDLEAAARAIVEDNHYMTIATADEQGVPWATPVWHAPSGDRELFWVSDPAARHSRNIAVRPEVSIAIFDSHSPIGTGRGVYLSGAAEQVTGAGVERGVDVFSRRSLDQGGRAWTAADVAPDARLRLYRAVVTERWIGNREDQRIQLAR